MEALRPALSPQSEKGKRLVREDGHCGDFERPMKKENVEGDWTVWTIEIEPETSRLKNNFQKDLFGRFRILNGRGYSEEINSSF